MAAEAILGSPAISPEIKQMKHKKYVPRLFTFPGLTRFCFRVRGDEFLPLFLFPLSPAVFDVLCVPLDDREEETPETFFAPFLLITPSFFQMTLRSLQFTQ